MAEMNAESKYNRAKQWEIALFSLNNSASNLYLFAFGFLTYYATGIVGLTTLTVASLLGGVRLFDGLIDPAIGVIMDRIDTKWGRFRPIMLISNIALILSFIILFSIHNFKDNAAMVYGIYVFALIFHKIGYSFQQTVTKAAQPALTNDPSQRPLFSIYDTIFSSIGVFAMMQVVVSNFFVPRHGDFNLGFYSEFLPFICVLSFILTILAMIGIARKDNKENFGLGEETVETKSIADYLSVVKGNVPLISLVTAGSIMKFVAQLFSDQVFVVMMFGIILGNYGLSGQISLIQIIPNLLIVMAFSSLATKKGLKISYTWSLITAIVSAAVLGFILYTSSDTLSIFAGGNVFANLASIGFTVFYILFRCTTSYPNSIVLTMAADITDFETARSGRFVSGMIGTVFSLFDSIASSLVPIVIGWIVAAIGFADAYPTAETPLSPALLNGGILILVVIPVVCMIVALIAIRIYPLDRNEMEKIAATIEAKKHGHVEADA